jgi:hypothetical protein
VRMFIDRLAYIILVVFFARPLVCGIDRVLFGGKSPLVVEKVFFLRYVVMSVGVAVVLVVRIRV